MTDYTYIAGPMTGIEEFNFPAFDAEEERLRKTGVFVVNPAGVCRAEGFDPAADKPQTHAEYMARDLPLVCRATQLSVLPGWEKSKGARIEIGVALALGIPCWPSNGLPRITELPPVDADCGILAEAALLTNGARQISYGHPLEDYTRTAAMWSAIIGAPVTAEQAILCMIAVKMSRECHRPKRDNRVDIAGYVNCLQMVAERRAG